MVLGERQVREDRKIGLLAGETMAYPSEEDQKKMRGGGGVSISTIAPKFNLFLCLASFSIGMLFAYRMWSAPHPNTNLQPLPQDCQHKHQQKLETSESKDIIGEVSKTHQAIQSLDKTISSLEMELGAARLASASRGMNSNGFPRVEKADGSSAKVRTKAFVVVGINTAFSSRKRRDSVRETWMPRGAKLKQLEEEKGIVIRFVIGHSATPGGILDRAIDTEDAEHNDFLRLDHVEGYHELSAKTKIYFSTALAKWDADFYVKVDDDVHVNLGMLATTLARYRSKPRIYIGCMKSGPVLSQKGVKYHEPEYWKFGEESNKYFRHATGQIYAISRDLVNYISINSPILHKYANEDVSLGAWLIGLEVNHVDERSMCCGTPPDCELKAEAGNEMVLCGMHCSEICLYQ
ncbi:hypothetical protein SUGI_0743560 [Cryptomeria japonica]|nr:hypothetical protein SUGI_0743560 [Cryptomeria japonica]